MTHLVLSVIFLLGASQPPSEGPDQVIVAGPEAPVAPAAEPKMICKYEHVTGSRLSKQKICRPENATGADQDDTALQRKMSRFGDFRSAPGDLDILGGAGIGN